MRRKLLIALAVVLVLTIVGAVAVAGFAWWEARSVVGELHAGPKRKVVAAVSPELNRKPKRTLVPPPPEAARRRSC